MICCTTCPPSSLPQAGHRAEAIGDQNLEAALSSNDRAARQPVHKLQQHQGRTKTKLSGTAKMGLTGALLGMNKHRRMQ
jgi:hypothetical protein